MTEFGTTSPSAVDASVPTGPTARGEGRPLERRGAVRFLTKILMCGLHSEQLMSDSLSQDSFQPALPLMEPVFWKKDLQGLGTPCLVSGLLVPS